MTGAEAGLEAPLVALRVAAVVADATNLLAPNVGVPEGPVDTLVAALPHALALCRVFRVVGPLPRLLGLPLSEEGGRGGGGREGWGNR